MRALRGRRIAMVFQEPMSALNPVFTVYDQISDALRTNLGPLQGRRRASESIELLSLVGIPSPHKRLDCYVHEFSGGMRQRVMLAMALSCNPGFLIADEPTTALDVTIQATILELITGMIERLGMSLLFITHNLGVVAHACDTIGVMYASHLVELGDKREIFANPQHPYTVGLLNSIPRLDAPGQVPDADRGLGVQHDGAAVGLQIPSALRPRHGCLPPRDPAAEGDRARPSRGVPPARSGVGMTMAQTAADTLLEVKGLTKHFTLHGDIYSKLAGEKTQVLKAVDGIDFHIRAARRWAWWARAAAASRRRRGW